MDVNDAITEQALAWHEAQRREAEVDWDAFTRWLDADPRHALAYDEVALLDDLVERNRATLATLVPDRPALGRRAPWRWAAAGGAVAAGLALLLGLNVPRAPGAPLRFAAQHEIRTLRLDDGTRIDLAPGSSVEIAAKGDAIALAGAAAFDVPHRPGRTLVVRAGGIEVRDIGTRFEVAAGGTTVRVAVAEGEVRLAAPAFAQPVALAAGKRALIDRDAGAVTIAPAAIGDFAAWRRGRLSYDDAPLALVAADVSRYTGAAVTLEPALGGRHFTGVLTIGDGSRLADDLADIMDLDVQRQGDRLRLVARRRR